VLLQLPFSSKVILQLPFWEMLLILQNSSTAIRIATPEKILAAVLLCFCVTVAPAPGSTAEEKKLQFPINNFNVSKQDPYASDSEMAAARTSARRHWPFFRQSFAMSPKTGASNFSVRVPITKGNVTERMWLAVDSIDGDKLRTRLSSQPEILRHLKPGQPMQANVADVEDWTFENGADEFGGFTIMVIYRREIQKVNGLAQKDEKKNAAAQSMLTQSWLSSLKQQMASPHHAVEISQAQTDTLTYLSKINALLCGNLGRFPSPEEVSARSGLPERTIDTIGQLAEFRRLHRL
jgi:uncharacterized protein YegJ (DUF2314 family)